MTVDATTPDGVAEDRRTAVAVPATTANAGPGFDATGLAIDLRLVVTAVPRAGTDVAVTNRGEGADELPTDGSHLVWRSVLAACDRFGWDVPAVDLVVDNPIPLARGLGSSSAAIVAGLGLARALADADAGLRVTDHAVGDVDLVALADELEGHPDNVAPALHGGVVVAARTDAGRLVVRTRPAPMTSRVLVLVPEEHSSTDETRAALPELLSRQDVTVQAARAAHMTGALVGAWPADAGLVGDRLHEPSRTDGTPGGALLSALRADGVVAWLSGGGPSIAAMVPTQQAETVLARVEPVATEHGFAARLLDWDRQGVRACRVGGCAVAGVGGCTDCPLRVTDPE